MNKELRTMQNYAFNFRVNSQVSKIVFSLEVRSIYSLEPQTIY